MLTSITKRPQGIKIAVPALILLAFASISGGEILLDDPSGNTMGIEPILPYLPFNLQDFTLVGVWLIAVYGVLAIILAEGLSFGKKWASTVTLGLGAVLITWILAEVFLLYSFGFTFFYPLIGGIGLLTITVLCLPSTREYVKG
ncbi:MAG TPA: hypothetical protein VD736_09240 [Nitrososphaera sp.]|nr:hypothetical protein [Nitrososphaera sp.]